MPEISHVLATETLEHAGSSLADLFLPGVQLGRVQIALQDFTLHLRPRPLHVRDPIELNSGTVKLTQLRNSVAGIFGEYGDRNPVELVTDIVEVG